MIILVDSYEAMQCEPELVTFDTYEDMTNYIYETKGLEDRLSNGYAHIITE